LFKLGVFGGPPPIKVSELPLQCIHDTCLWKTRFVLGENPSPPLPPFAPTICDNKAYLRQKCRSIVYDDLLGCLKISPTCHQNINPIPPHQGGPFPPGQGLVLVCQYHFGCAVGADGPFIPPP
jgi:hypothetical protein